MGPHGRVSGPRPLGEVLNRLFLTRGYTRTRAAGELEQAWYQAVGEAHGHETRVVSLKRGILTIETVHPALASELASYRRAELLESIRRAVPDRQIRDLRFRLGEFPGNCSLS